ncbi:murein L,D-transpeptidase catalytic domain family protein [Rhizobium lusitanum]|uniref:L,D-transpeptidase catalytic domain n=1 Tax=Rhizobium lusitanum TaxID=293958 RepID=A0A7X0IQ30_9HYPH|nr:murein L,D-transpeptidase catalytic domain family protein [Rhizobium lusitanum]MBB6484677.1 hypothetical protein [Rhizobium lusitanum]
MRLKYAPLSIVRMLSLCSVAIIVANAPPALATEQLPDIPTWLTTHVGQADGQIARPVLQRARSLYMRKVSEGTVRNPCYFAMDATRPNDPADGGRFYIVCEATQTFRVVSSGHGSGRDLKGVADFGNGRMCAKNFGNAMDSNLTTGGSYLTEETKTTFKGYYRGSQTKDTAYLRTFLQFDGEGETANARQRAIGGHAAAKVAGVCMKKDPQSPYANREGYVPLGKLVEYAGGRSDGCTSWSASDANQIISMVKDNPTTLYIYPESKDISAVAKAAAAGRSPSQAGLYWNDTCMKQIRAPKFWSKETLEPVIVQYKKDHPAPPARPIPICE